MREKVSQGQKNLVLFTSSESWNSLVKLFFFLLKNMRGRGNLRASAKLLARSFPLEAERMSRLKLESKVQLTRLYGFSSSASK
jgi:hypothetical protein